ncbi:hypothetical protein Efla_004875 [Eimeria flavescens]
MFKLLLFALLVALSACLVEAAWEPPRSPLAGTEHNQFFVSKALGGLSRWRQSRRATRFSSNAFLLVLGVATAVLFLVLSCFRLLSSKAAQAAAAGRRLGDDGDDACGRQPSRSPEKQYTPTRRGTELLYPVLDPLTEEQLNLLGDLLVREPLRGFNLHIRVLPGTFLPTGRPTKGELMSYVNNVIERLRNPEAEKRQRASDSAESDASPSSAGLSIKRTRPVRRTFQWPPPRTSTSEDEVFSPSPTDAGARSSPARRTSSLARLSSQAGLTAGQVYAASASAQTAAGAATRRRSVLPSPVSSTSASSAEEQGSPSRPPWVRASGDEADARRREGPVQRTPSKLDQSRLAAFMQADLHPPQPGGHVKKVVSPSSGQLRAAAGKEAQIDKEIEKHGQVSEQPFASRASVRTTASASAPTSPSSFSSASSSQPSAPVSPAPTSPSSFSSASSSQPSAPVSPQSPRDGTAGGGARFPSATTKAPRVPSQTGRTAEPVGAASASASTSSDQEAARGSSRRSSGSSTSFPPADEEGASRRPSWVRTSDDKAEKKPTRRPPSKLDKSRLSLFDRPDVRPLQPRGPVRRATSLSSNLLRAAGLQSPAEAAAAGKKKPTDEQGETPASALPGSAEAAERKGRSASGSTSKDSLEYETAPSDGPQAAGEARPADSKDRRGRRRSSVRSLLALFETLADSASPQTEGSPSPPPSSTAEDAGASQEPSASATVAKSAADGEDEGGSSSEKPVGEEGLTEAASTPGSLGKDGERPLSLLSTSSFGSLGGAAGFSSPGSSRSTMVFSDDSGQDRSRKPRQPPSGNEEEEEASGEFASAPSGKDETSSRQEGEDGGCGACYSLANQRYQSKARGDTRAKGGTRTEAINNESCFPAFFYSGDRQSRRSSASLNIRQLIDGPPSHGRSSCAMPT